MERILSLRSLLTSLAKSYQASAKQTSPNHDLEHSLLDDVYFPSSIFVAVAPALHDISIQPTNPSVQDEHLNHQARWESIICNQNFSSLRAFADNDASLPTKAKAISNKIAAYQSLVQSNAKAHIESLCSSKDTKCLRNITDPEELKTFFKSQFGEKNFFLLWAHMQKDLDYEGTSELGRDYLEDLYVETCTKMKLMMGAGDGYVLGAR